LNNNRSYRHGGLIRDAIQQTATSKDTDRDALIDKRASLAKEIPAPNARLSATKTPSGPETSTPHDSTNGGPASMKRLGSLRGQDQVLARDLAQTPPRPPTPQLSTPSPTKSAKSSTRATRPSQALVRILIAEPRVNSRNEILPSYRVGAPWFARRTVQWS
jgi:hypothetical protein